MMLSFLKTVFFAGIFMVGGALNAISAQSITPEQLLGDIPYQSPSCNLKDHHEFDFMHGTWDLKVLVDGRWKPGGISVHKPGLGGCVSFEYSAYENWGDFYKALTGRDGVGVFAVNSYDKAAHNWRQAWFDDSGTVVSTLRGRKFSDGMRFVGHAPDGKGSELQRFEWKVLGKNLREFAFDLSTDGGQNWTRIATVQMVRKVISPSK